MRISLLVAFVFVALTIFDGCNKPDPAQPSTSVADQISPEQARLHIGERMTVAGVVTQVSMSKKGHTFVNFGGTYPNEVFAVVVFASDTSKFTDLRGLTGKRVAVTGRIKLYKGKPEIVLSSAADLQQ